jgi:hypothetical protein
LPYNSIVYIPYLLLSKKSYIVCEVLEKQAESELPTGLLVSEI